MTTKPTTMLAAPTMQPERIIIFDSRRGFAIPGILLLNIFGFGIAPIAISDFSVQLQGALNYFRFDPVKWARRSLTYWKKHLIKRMSQIQIQWALSSFLING